MDGGTEDLARARRYQPLRGAAELLELVPRSRFVDVRGTGHMVAGDDNDVVAREVLEFLDTLPA